MRGKSNPALPVAQPHRASNGFSEAEVRLMASLMRQLLMGGDLRQLARTKVLRGVAEKFSKMGARVRSEREGRAA